MRDKGFNVNDIGKPDRGFELQHHLQVMQKVFKIVSDRSGLDMIVYAKAYIRDTAGYFELSKERTDLLSC